MKGLRSIPRVLKINWVTADEYLVSLLFNNGESRVVNIKEFFDGLRGQGHQHLRDQILSSPEMFTTAEVIGNTLGWPTIGTHGTDLAGNDVFYSYDLDPIMIYEAGTTDTTQTIDVGEKIKTLRLQQGMTQTELAERSGTSKHYISRLENNHSDIELMTLKKIVEAGLDRKLSVEIS